MCFHGSFYGDDEIVPKRSTSTPRKKKAAAKTTRKVKAKTKKTTRKVARKAA